MRFLRQTAVIATVLLAVVVLSACTSSKPSKPTESPQDAGLNAALATAGTSVADASTYIIGLKQSIPGTPSNDDLNRLQTTLNAASAQTGAARQASAQSALDQFNAGIAKVTQAYDAAMAGSPEQEQLRQLIATLEVGRDALGGALIK
jgi:hypothetical protein